MMNSLNFTVTDSAAGNTRLPWNSQAVAHLQGGRVDTCILLLKEELAKLQSRFSWGDSQGQEESDSTMLLEEPGMTVVSIPTPAIWDNADNNLFSLYPRVFVLENNTSSNPSRSPDTKQQTIYAVVLLYNLAFSYHVKAAQNLQRQNNGWYKKCLDCARNLYTSALGMVSASWDESDYGELSFLLLAIVNNLGYISCQQMDFLEMRRYMGMLCELITSSSSLAGNMSGGDIEVFLDSVSTFLDGGLDHSLRAAPAA